MNVIEEINKNAGFISLVFSLVVTVATVVTAWLNARLVSETRRMREAQTEPAMQVTYRGRENFLGYPDIVVRNIGMGPARDIRFEVSADIPSGDVNDAVDSLNKLACFSNGLAYLGPGQEFSSFWTSMYENHASKIQTKVWITCRYLSMGGRKFEDRCLLDLSELKGISRIGTPPLQNIEKHLLAIQKEMEKWSRSGARLKADVFTQADRDAEQAEWEAERAVFTEKGKPAVDN
jgi:hypothetical protein